MRGGIESSQAFLALIRMWRAHPNLFDPLLARWYSMEYVQGILKDYIGWDSETAAYNWVTNSRRLCDAWDGNPLNLIKGVKTYDEACRRIRNKRTKTELEAAGPDGQGFEGFQYKMVSMLLYFYDWEGWLKPRFLYPSPADFHNFRVAFSVSALVAHELEGDTFSIDEDVSYPWREVVMDYMRTRKADPVELSDAVWLFSLLLCGNSPFTVTAEVAETTLIEYVPSAIEPHPPLSFKRGKALAATCLVCPIERECKMAIPAKPYYRKGKFVLRARRPVAGYIDQKLLREPPAYEPPPQNLEMFVIEEQFT
jgi:hypothetical protein